MAVWPFGKKKNNPEPDTAVADGAGETSEPGGSTTGDAPVPSEPLEATGDTASTAEAAPIPGSDAGSPVSIAHDAIGGETGPFDGDNVNIDDFDFTDFSQATLNLGSVRVPLPLKSQVQVEMGQTGPKMVHIVTAQGRATPVAFAAPRTGGMWQSSSEEIAQGMRAEGMPVHFETGPWGREIVGTGENGVIRIIGVEGPRWLYRVTLASPHGKEDEMAEVGREIVARSFIYRGEDPILAGNSLPVILPAQLAKQVQQAVQARAAQQGQAAPAPQGQSPTPGTPTALSEAMQKVMERNNPASGGTEGERNN